MTWLETFPAVPLLGLQWDHRYVVSTERLAPLTAFLDRLQESNQGLTITNANPWDLEIQTTSGYEFKFHTNTVTIGFSYFRAARPRFGDKGLPVLPALDACPYDELLRRVLGYADEVLAALAQQPITVKRIGLVATVPVIREQAPPGLQAFLQRLDAVTEHQATESQCRLGARLGQNDGTEDHCIHTVRLIDQPRRTGGNGPTLEVQLDYQRHFDPGVRLGKLKGPTAPRTFADEAVAYFERFGAGV